MNNKYLIIVGDGSELEKYKEISDDYVIFAGFKNKLILFMNIAEGFSISVIEALNCGLLLLL